MEKDTIAPKKVLHIIPGFGGGISSHVRNLVNSIDTNKIIIDVASFTECSDDFIKDINNKKGKVFILKNVRLKTIKENVRQYSSILKNNGKYDMIHMHLTDFQALYFSVISRFYGVKQICSHAHISNHENGDKLINRIKMSIKRKITRIAANRFVSCSKLASKYLFGKRMLENNKIMHIPNSIVVNRFIINIDETFKKRFYYENNIKKTSLIIGHIGYFGYQKNHPFMVKIIERMKERNIDFMWLFIGTGNDIDKIKNMIKEKNCEDYVRFLNRREDVNYLYQLMNVTVLPSYFEGLPTVTIESQAAGVPTVISDSITSEVDMGMGLVKFLSLNDAIDCWIDSIIEMSKVDIVPSEIRKDILKRKAFTSESAAKLYEEFVYGIRNNFNLGDNIY